MAITIERRNDEDRPDKGKCTYVRLWGQDRENLQKIAIWAGRSTQDTGEDLIRQAMEEVLKKIPDFEPGDRVPRTRRYGRGGRRG